MTETQNNDTGEDWRDTARWVVEAAVLLSRTVAARLREDRLTQVAASLAYTSLIALVPLLAIGLGIVSAFPGFQDTRAEILNLIGTALVPEVGETVQTYLTTFASAATGLTMVGIIGLVVSAGLMLSTIEKAFNTIFRVTKGRSLLARVLVYWSVLTLGPLLMGASLSLASWMYAVGNETLGGVTELLVWAAPLVLAALAFAFLYMALPYRPVHYRDALVGGVVAALLFTALRGGFALFASSAGTYQTLYGALAALPLFLVWMYACWAVVLAGAVLTSALPEWRAKRSLGAASTGAAARFRATITVLRALRKTSQGQSNAGRDDLLAKTGLPEAAVEQATRTLAKAGWITATAGGDWVLARDLRTVTLAHVLKALDLDVASVLAGADVPEQRLAAEVAQALAPVLAVSLDQVLEDQPAPVAALSAAAAAASNASKQEAWRAG